MSKRVYLFGIGSPEWQAATGHIVNERGVPIPVRKERMNDTIYILATPVTGDLEVHVKGCQHLPRLKAQGGGSLSWGTLDEMVAQGVQEVGRKPKVAGCVRAAAKAAAS